MWLPLAFVCNLSCLVLWPLSSHIHSGHNKVLTIPRTSPHDSSSLSPAVPLPRLPFVPPPLADPRVLCHTSAHHGRWVPTSFWRTTSAPTVLKRSKLSFQSHISLLPFPLERPKNTISHLTFPAFKIPFSWKVLLLSFFISKYDSSIDAQVNSTLFHELSLIVPSLSHPSLLKILWTLLLNLFEGT